MEATSEDGDLTTEDILFVISHIFSMCIFSRKTQINTWLVRQKVQIYRLKHS